ncbi:MAG TPA: CPBP family intramembrane glutamic endopeptidase [Cyclobacteriaceae bacterium]|nr:CPBP family intramembrane glutamic endopeptidase [Cyclobacteriaceae bacterium]
MSENLVSDRRPVSSLLQILLLLVFGFVFIGPAVGLLASTLIYGPGFIEALTSPRAHPEYNDGIILAQGLGATVGLVLLPWMYLRNFEKRSINIFFKNDISWPVLIASVAALIVAFSTAISPVVDWNAHLEFPDWMSTVGNWIKTTELQANEMTKALTDNLTPGRFAVTFIVVAIIAAVGEELMFRGMIQTELTRVLGNHHAAIWLAAALFSAIHLQFLGFVPRLLLGAVLGYLYYWSGNLWVPVIGHLLNNGIQLVVLYLYQNGMVSLDIESTESAPWPYVVAALIATIFLLFFLKNYFARQSPIARDSAQ